ncbi:MAG: peptidoglycan binding protein CsiV [Sulfuricaulis sp.]|nr:peptidoglycan binding protein CsiV [Sulfuricaulis sp.]
MYRLLLSIFLMFLPLSSLPAAPVTTNTYEIEVVVFENRQSDLEGEETWSRTQPGSLVAEKDEMLVAGEKLLPESPLWEAAVALEKSGRHHILTHLRWQQSAEAKSGSKPVKIASESGELGGSLRFYLSRYLIVDLNLILRVSPSGGFFGVVGQEKEATVFRLSEPRRIKVSEINYFDHPKFGALVRVSPVKTTN